jgi:hypothetical protein
MQATSNTANVTVNIAVRVHNVAIANVTSYNIVVSQGYSLNITVTAADPGEYPETFNVTVYANTTIVGTQTVNNLPNGTSTVLNFIWNTTGFAEGNYTISAYAWPVPGETNTADNTFTDGTIYVGAQMLQGDINQDGIVDILDAIILSGSFNSEPGTPRWNANADLNGDGIIDIYDAITLAQNYGKTA